MDDDVFVWEKLFLPKLPTCWDDIPAIPRRTMHTAFMEGANQTTAKVEFDAVTFEARPTGTTRGSLTEYLLVARWVAKKTKSEDRSFFSRFTT